jgi:hypothetical protein
MSDPHDRASDRWEALLRSKRGRVLLVVAAVLGLSAVLTVQFTGFAEDRGREVDSARVFASQLVRWGLWGLLAFPIVGFARWSWSGGRPWTAALALQLVLAPAVAYGHSEVVDWTVTTLDLRPPSSGPERGPPHGTEGDRAPPGDDRPAPGGDRPPPGEGRPPPGEGRPQSPGRGGFSRRSTWDQVFGAFTYVFILGLGAGLHTWLRTRQEERRATALEQAATRLQGELDRARLDRLTAQLRPHFLFNTLHAVGGLVREERSAEALATLAAVGDLLRASLDPRGRQELPLTEELRAARGYLAIESIRLGERLMVVEDVDPDCEAAYVPALVLLPLLENAVTHAAEPRVEPTTLRLAARRDGERLLLVIEDDGAGFPDAVLSEGVAVADDRPHIGLSNTRSRLQGLYGEAGVLELGVAPGGGARVTAGLPWHTAPPPGTVEDDVD